MIFQVAPSRFESTHMVVSSSHQSTIKPRPCVPSLLEIKIRTGMILIPFWSYFITWYKARMRSLFFGSTTIEAVNSESTCQHTIATCQMRYNFSYLRFFFHTGVSKSIANRTCLPEQHREALRCFLWRVLPHCRLHVNNQLKFWLSILVATSSIHSPSIKKKKRMCDTWIGSNVDPAYCTWNRVELWLIRCI